MHKEGGTLLACQSEREPVEYTHFDMWPCGYGSIDDLERVLSSWENSLGCSLIDLDLFGSFDCMVSAVGFDNTLDLMILGALVAGYDVYRGDNFIEIYANN